MQLRILDNEYWYGGNVVDGSKMPFRLDSDVTIDLTENQTPNQSMPLFISTKGRVIWRDTGYIISFKNGVIDVPNDVVVIDGYKNLKGAYLAAMKSYFPFKNRIPARELFESPIYNTWIELTFHQSQPAIEKYAEDIISNDMPPGVLMIDDGWSNYYGDWTFHTGNFPNPKRMVDHLKSLGFKVMLWICPFISADTIKYREAVAKDILIKTPEGEPFITKWWNGYSAVLDMTNLNAQKWLKEQMNELQELGIDGFKFDAGDSKYYKVDNETYHKTTPDGQSNLWAKFGEQYPFNEYRVTFRAGGYPLLQRLCDKNHSWTKNGIASLIPDTLVQGITGHPFSCPDMIGGGEYLNFQELSGNLDPELFVRHAEIACLMPSMQFSAAPYRILDKHHFSYVQKSIAVRNKYAAYMMSLVDHAAETGEPIVRYMSYEFPDAPVEKITNQFMLGERYLVAPIVEKGKTSRKVYLPKGSWEHNNKEFQSNGENVEVVTEFGEPAIFKKLI
ncbi:glycoside hydrolase family 31 protein [Lederbergia sp. NSJ-179]|uniref:glycoside hydrolase family 31 protein n=1 Tax=Lederbergia sp. NSJ-179 TaxID=2931402 RepID=UPI001FD60D84|nr:glycoside hydrolase family 31 protein [Lederbergia sp. NSJ-179]MCJ7842318.1 glycoside hydrolase family 31 protein [Lederbergia sp. NSJ-179]